MNGNRRTIKLMRLKMVCERGMKYRALTTSREVAKVVGPLLDYREQVFVIGLDNASMPTVIHQVGAGGVGSCTVELAGFFKVLLLSNCSAFVIVHNHPANTLEASPEDWSLTARLLKGARTLGLSMLDHVIVNSDGSKSVSLRSDVRWPS